MHIYEHSLKLQPRNEKNVKNIITFLLFGVNRIRRIMYSVGAENGRGTLRENVRRGYFFPPLSAIKTFPTRGG